MIQTCDSSGQWQNTTTCSNPHGSTVCLGGTCSPTCDVGFKSCDGNPDNGCEADLSSDPNNCNGCGNVCAKGTTCINGACGTSCITAETVGDYHGCALRTDSTLWCWGRNQYGQIGDGTTTDRHSPVQVTALGSNVASVSAGEQHTCAIENNRSLWCWGYNIHGGLGDGSTTDRHSPVQVTALGTSVVEVSGGSLNMCARKADNTMWCWGDNYYGEIGDGTTTDRHTPVQVTALGANVAYAAAGWGSACAIKTDSTLWCWGRNQYGAVGDGTTTDRHTPVQVTKLGTGVVQVGIGASHACARKSDGTMWCWGYNTSGEVGDGTTTQRNSPVQVTALGNNVASIIVGGYHTCAIKTDGTLWCWGQDRWGQIGDGTITNTPRATPAQVSLDSNVVVLDGAAGFANTCARPSFDQVLCWGYDLYGDIGNGTTGYEVPKPTLTLVPCP